MGPGEYGTAGKNANAVTITSSNETRLSPGLEVRFVHVGDVPFSGSRPPPGPGASESGERRPPRTVDMFAFFDADSGTHLLTAEIGP